METFNNLVKAFVGECQARNRYTFYSGIAKDEGFEQIAEVFLLTAENEKEHAEKFFEHIQELKKKFKIENNPVVNTDVIIDFSNTKENLKSAIKGENHEYSVMYKEFANTAKKEGFAKIANRFIAISVAEKHHEQRYKKILNEVEKKSVFKKKKVQEWMCRKCGYIHKGIEAPNKCLSCDHEKSFYEIKCEVY
jgi:rubrerythrin